MTVLFELKFKERPAMSELALRFKDELLQLPEVDRLELANFLWDSVDGPDVDSDYQAEWVAELDRRVADLEAGRATAEPLEDVIAELRAEALRERQTQ
jgi:putative addiction module component (TIGR02574 family)